MTRRPVFVALVSIVVLGTGIASAAPPDANRPTAGATGVGDPYYPTDGNGGYDVILRPRPGISGPARDLGAPGES